MTEINQQVQRQLSEEIRLLGGLLGDIIRRLAGEQAFELVEEIRTAAKALRAEPSVEAAKSLRERLDRLELLELRTLIRAFSIYFDLVNLPEQQARVRANRLRTLKMAPEPLAESPQAALAQLRENGCAGEQVTDLLERALLSCVFTAHPREEQRDTRKCWG